MVSVAAAQHPTTNMGKSYSNGKQPAASKQQPEKGIYFTEQWTRALQLDPQFVLVTQWNEWMAQRFLSNGSDSFLGKTLPSGETYFVDVYSAEYSRDIAPMKGGYGDNYYYLLADYIRQFKGARENPVITKTQTVNVKDFSTINSSGTVYYDDLYDTMHRDHPGSASSQNYHYKDTSGRNDFEEVRVASDANNIYFYVRTVDNITSPEGTNWMNLMLNIDANYKTGWHGYDYLVNRVRVGNKATIERFDASGKYELEYVADAEISYSGKEMVIGISRSSIRIPGNSFTVDFKFADNIPEEDDIMLFIDKGDVAPNNRFNYRYIFGSKTINVVPDTATARPALKTPTAAPTTAKPSATPVSPTINVTQTVAPTGTASEVTETATATATTAPTETDEATSPTTTASAAKHKEKDNKNDNTLVIIVVVICAVVIAAAITTLVLMLKKKPSDKA